MRAVNSRAGFFFVKWLLRPSGLFLCYAVEQRFADYFVSRSRQSKIRWSPYLVGVIRQGGAISLNFAITSSEHDFRDQTAKAHLASAVTAMSRHTTYFGAK